MKCPNPQCDNGMIYSKYEHYMPGKGMVPYPTQKCLLCNGTGEIKQKNEEIEMKTNGKISCPVCKGTSISCAVCAGRGYLNPRNTLQLSDGRKKEFHAILRDNDSLDGAVLVLRGNDRPIDPQSSKEKLNQMVKGERAKEAKTGTKPTARTPITLTLNDGDRILINMPHMSEMTSTQQDGQWVITLACGEV